MFFDSLAFHRLRVRVAQHLFTPLYFSDGERQNSEFFDRFRAFFFVLLPQAYWTAVYTRKSNIADKHGTANFENASMNFADMFATFAAATTDRKETHLRYKGIEWKFVVFIGVLSRKRHINTGVKRSF